MERLCPARLSSTFLTIPYAPTPNWLSFANAETISMKEEKPRRWNKKHKKEEYRR